MAVSDIINGANAGLVKVANVYVSKLKTRISQNNLPKVISDAISIGVPQSAGKMVSIDVAIDLKKAPMAAAYEWGSGIHSMLKEPQKYVIVPRRGRYLVIPKERLKYPPEHGDYLIVRKVLHPGVAPRQYITPSLAEMPKEIKQILGKEFKAAIMIGINPITTLQG